MRTFPNWAYALEALAYVAVGAALVWSLAQVWTARAQTITGEPTYTVADPDQPGLLDLAMPNGRYLIQMGNGCEGISAGQEVYWLAGSHDVGAISPADRPEVICNVYIAALVSPQPCATNADGACDVDAEPAS